MPCKLIPVGQPLCPLHPIDQGYQEHLSLRYLTTRQQFCLLPRRGRTGRLRLLCWRASPARMKKTRFPTQAFHRDLEQSIDAQAKQNHREIKEEFGTLKQSIEELRILFITKAVSSNPNNDKPAAQPVSSSGKRTTNPRPTKEFSELIIKIATEYRSRVGHKETGNVVINARKASTGKD
ncbi:hypothetical protein RSOLAG22IIIB_12792 [Rhizoctonia solani]|uniref:Uncharacterized protein n=1 Tax=Rhizoctonia solani TaxID=456999 RepID=A0A0K6GGG8_9AGAM|nr:hypothetical protein RSOLAG22IIIB_12792 [Rhizoctonia solani]